MHSPRPTEDALPRRSLCPPCFMRRQPRPARWSLACTLLILASIAGVARAAPILPTPVPYDQLTTEPYRHVGLVRTDSYGADPTVLGSGWVAGERVVASAAHTFFVPATLGWNRNRWYWRRAAPAGTYWYTQDMQVPRSYRVLAGYAAAARR